MVSREFLPPPSSILLLELLPPILQTSNRNIDRVIRKKAYERFDRSVLIYLVSNNRSTREEKKEANEKAKRRKIGEKSRWWWWRERVVGRSRASRRYLRSSRVRVCVCV